MTLRIARKLNTVVPIPNDLCTIIVSYIPKQKSVCVNVEYRVRHRKRKHYTRHMVSKFYK